MKKTRFALLDTLLEAQDNGNQIDDAGIQEEVDTFVFTGFDTVSLALINAFMVIANHPEQQQRLYEEISQALGKTRVQQHRLYNFWVSCEYVKVLYLQCIYAFIKSKI